MGEVKVQRGLNYAALISLISIPITGPIGMLGVGVSLTTKFARRTNLERENKYLEEKRELKKQRKKQKLSKNIARFVEKENERRGYETSLNNGKRMVEDYLSNLPQNQYYDINQIEIIEKDETFLGFSTGNKSLEVKIKWMI